MAAIETHNHYQVLGVDRKATSDEIKRAWARLVRMHTPDKDPEGNARINRAKAVLLDAETRQQYDALLDFRGDIYDLWEVAEEAENRGDWEHAIDSYTEILALNPADHFARNQLALCLMQGERYNAALETIEALIAKKNDVAFFWSSYSTILFRCASASEDTRKRDEALKALERAGELEPHNAQYHSRLAMALIELEEFEKAEASIQRAIYADGKADLSDINTLVLMPYLHIVSGSQEHLKGDLEFIRSLIPPDDPDALEFAAYGFFQLAEYLGGRRCYSSAYHLVQLGEEFAPLHDQYLQWRTELRRRALVIAERVALAHDDEIIKPIAGIALCLGRDNYEPMDPDDRLQKVCVHIGELTAYPQEIVDQGILDFSRKYPELRALNDPLFQSLQHHGCRSSESTNATYVGKEHASTHAPTSGSKRGCFFLPCLVLMIHGLVLLLYLLTPL